MSIIKLRTKKVKEEDEIDNIAQYSQQRRSPPPKRRTDFSFFFVRDSLSNLQDSKAECVLSAVTRATLDHKKSKVLKEGRPSSQRPLFRNPTGERSNSDEQDPLRDKSNSPSSSQTENEFLGKRRGKRSRKPKVHFDGTPFPSSQVINVRRLRILRYLGLIAPAGSPFSLTRV